MVPLQVEVAELHDQLRRYAEQANWEELARVMKRRDGLLGGAPINARSELLASALDCNQTILEHAIKARRVTAEQLTELKRGRVGTSRYAGNRQLGL